jgi:hypothetical protein
MINDVLGWTSTYARSSTKRWQAIWGKCVLSENDLAIMAMTTFKFSAAVLHLVAIACIMLVAVHVTETARELEDGVGGVLRNREQVASVHTNAELTGFQAGFLALCPPVL